MGAQGNGLSAVFRGLCGLNYGLSVKLMGSDLRFEDSKIFVLMLKWSDYGGQI